MKTITILVSVLLLAVSAGVYSQNETARIWTSSYNSGVKDVSKNMVTDAGGNIYTAGYKSVSGSTEDTTARITLVKYSPQGELLWSKVFHSRLGRRTAAYSMTGDEAGNIYICGIADTNDAFGLVTRGLIIKYNSDGDTIWARYYGSSFFSSQYNDVKVDASSNVYVGYTFPGSFMTGNFVSSVVKYNSSGVYQWISAAVPGCLSFKVELNNSNDIYVCGYKFVSVGVGDIYIAKISPQGITQWTSSYNNPSNAMDFAVDMKSDPVSGDAVITAYSGGLGVSDIETIKFGSALGQVLWVKRTTGTQVNSNNIPNALRINSTGDVYICGLMTNTGSGGDGFIIKYRGTDGNELWRRMYDSTGTGTENTTAIEITSTGDILAAGVQFSTRQAYLSRYSPNGTRIWNNVYNDSLHNLYNIPVSIAAGLNNSVIVAGNDTTAGSWDINTAMFDNLGVNYTTVCKNTYQPIRDNQVSYDTMDVNLGTDKVIRVELKIDSLMHSYPRNLVISLISPTGIIDTVFSNSGPLAQGQGLLHTIFTDSAAKPIDSGSVSYTGNFMPKIPMNVFNSHGLNGKWILRIHDAAAGDTGAVYKWCMNIAYEAPIGIQPIGNEIPKSFILGQNYPNPFNPVTNIKFSVPQSGIVTLKVYDILGRLISELVNEFRPAGNYAVDYNAAGLSSGIYFYRFESGEFTDTKKMVLVK